MDLERDIPEEILDLLASTGYTRSQDPSSATLDLLTGVFSWLIALCNTSNGLNVPLHNGGIGIQDDLNDGETISGLLRAIGCPYPLESHEIQGLDYHHIYPVLRWLVNRVISSQKNTGHEKITDLCARSHDAGEKLNASLHDSNLNDLDHLYRAAIEMCNRAEKVLASKLKEILYLKRLLDDMPTQLELIQYEQRFSELYMQIQEKLQHTRRLYDTYNALLETKELASKEASLLNSIHLQFQDANTHASGRAKLIDSLESIRKGSQQKLEKLRLILEEEQNKCAGLKEKLAATTEEQYHFSSLLKSVQDGYAKNEQLRSAKPQL